MAVTLPTPQKPYFEANAQSTLQKLFVYSYPWQILDSRYLQPPLLVNPSKTMLRFSAVRIALETK
jgi:hypothetical protein